MTRETIVVAGALAQKPNRGGHTWVFLQYLLGFKRLGWDVLFLDHLEPEMCLDSAGQSHSLDRSANLEYFRQVMERFGLGDCYAVLIDRGQRCLGLPRERVLERVRGSAFLLNVVGFLRDEEILAAAPRRVFLDIDPGFGQIWRELGLHDLFRGHDDFVTIAENLGQPFCAIPTCELDWVTTRQPVVLEHWPAQLMLRGDSFTSIASWRGAYGPLEYRGKTYGLRVHEFRKFVELPRLSGQRFQIALDIHPSEVNDLALLDASGWERVDPCEAAGDPWAYQAFIQSSRAELMVAKNIYVQTASGWFSDRSICYLASGRPVLAQDTGLGRIYPLGEGLLSFTTLEEAVAGTEAILADPQRHSRAARRIAEEYFDSDLILNRLLERLGAA